MASILAKLGVRSQPQAMVFAVRHRVVETRQTLAGSYPPGYGELGGVSTSKLGPVFEGWYGVSNGYCPNSPYPQ